MRIRYTLAWLILLVAAFVNAFLRESFYKNAFGDLHAHQLSTLTAMVLFGVIIWGLTRLWPLASAQEAWRIGFIWLALTLAFEFLFGHFVAGQAWAKLFADYNLLAGRVWLLLLIWITIAPFVFYKIAARRGMLSRSEKSRSVSGAK
jgi:hypothetical protein